MTAFPTSALEKDRELGSSMASFFFLLDRKALLGSFVGRIKGPEVDQQLSGPDLVLVRGLTEMLGGKR